MAVIKPFGALRFTEELSTLVAPPYDVISPEERAKFAASNPHNLVHLTLPEGGDNDRSQFVKYAHANSLLTEWRKEGVLKADEKPAFYRYLQTFRDPVSGKQHTRTALFVLLKTEPYENGVVLPHEQTFPKHKEDRQRLLESTRTHLESIYGLYNDPLGEVEQILLKAEYRILATVSTPDEIVHKLAFCDDPESCKKIQEVFTRHKIWIADGHHRYETSMNYRKQHVTQTDIAPEDYLPIALSSLQDPGLIVLPTHRMIRTVTDEQIADLPNILSEYFTVEEAPFQSLGNEVRSRGKNSKVIGIVLKDKGYLCTLKDPKSCLTAIEGDYSDLWKSLDVSILHSLIMEKLLDLPKNVEAYTRDEKEVFEKVGSGEYKMGFLVNAPSVEDTRDIAATGEKMPQKSTFFYPKLLSGLVMWSFNDPIG